MAGRRAFLAGLLATGAFPNVTWAEAGGPAFLSAGAQPDGRYVLCGLDARGDIVFQLPLPERGHAAAAHPVRPEAVAFARRPGRFAIVLDCISGRRIARLDAPEGRHFYGHGVFSRSGRYLYTTENEYDAARGVIGVWDVERGYRRVAEFASGGIGPHDIKLLPDQDVLVVANGGIETHPDAGRAKLNIPVMRPNLSYLALGGNLIDQFEPEAALHKNSIRHLAVAADGLVAFAMQWQGDVANNPPLLGLHRLGGAAQLLAPEDPGSLAAMQGYAGSVAFSSDCREVAITSPRGGLCQIYDTAAMTLSRVIEAADVCGVVATGQGFLLTAGTGDITSASAPPRRHHPVHWDNHIVPLSAA